MRKLLTAVLSTLVIVGFVPSILASNQPIAGSGCTDPRSYAELGRVPDELTGRKMVGIGVDPSTPMLELLEKNEHPATAEEFLETGSGNYANADERYVLLVGHRLDSDDPQNADILAHAKAYGVPIVVEGFDKWEFKKLTGLTLSSESAVVQFAPGGRAQTITLIHQPPQGPSLESAENDVNRAIEKQIEALKEPILQPKRQAYAQNIWNVWLHTGNVVCILPYYEPEQAQFPQTGNLDVGVRITLVAQKEPLEKVIDMQNLGTGFTPLAPGVVPIDYAPYFKGALTLSTTYDGKLTAPKETGLSGKANAVEPKIAVNEHSVTKTNGFTWGLTSSCGYGKTGPGCMIGANFSFTNTTSKTETIAERVIDASSNFGDVQDPQGKICGNPGGTCSQAEHTVQYYLSSTATSDGGKPIDPRKNDWYNFFDHPANRIWSTPQGDAFLQYCNLVCVHNKEYPRQPTIRSWPPWSFKPALTEAEAGYIFSPSYTNDLNLHASFKGTEGIFTYGTGPKKSNRWPSFTVQRGLRDAYYLLDLFTNSATAAADIGIDAGQVNYSGMPTCAMLNFTQHDVGIWRFLNKTNRPLMIDKVAAFQGVGKPLTDPIPTVADDYEGSSTQVLGVSETVIKPGQYQYVATCSSEDTTGTYLPALVLYYDNGAGANGNVQFYSSGGIRGRNVFTTSIDEDKKILTFF